MSEHVTSDEPYLLVEEVAERLGLPLSVLLHRVEAGDIPARRVERADGLHYALRLGDLGIELDDQGLRSAAISEDRAQAGADSPADDDTQGAPTGPAVDNAIFPAFDSSPAPLPGTWDVPSGAGEEEGDEPGPLAGWGPGSRPIERPWQPSAEPPPPWALREREPQVPPVWLNEGRVADLPAGDVEAEPIEAVADIEIVEVVDHDDEDDRNEAPGEPLFGRREAAATTPAGMQDDAPFFAPDLGGDADDDEDTAVAELAVPPPGREPVSLVEGPTSSPRGDLASMSLDARELVAGLLDRWERTLEQRIYTEQRQRFQAELVARQNMVKQLQMELHTARAEHAAAQAEKDRLLAGKERELADRERDLAETRRVAEEAERLAAPAAARRRRWFWNRDD